MQLKPIFKDSPQKRILNIIKKNKLGRLATSEEVAELIIFLCSKKASYKWRNNI